MPRGGKREGSGRPFARGTLGPKARWGSVVDRLRDGRKVFELKYVPCGAGCSRCRFGNPNFDPDRPGHGPYWYQIRLGSDGRKRREYIGRSISEGIARRLNKGVPS